jgi:hypothetical protein
MNSDHLKAAAEKYVDDIFPLRLYTIMERHRVGQGYLAGAELMRSEIEKLLLEIEYRDVRIADLVSVAESYKYSTPTTRKEPDFIAREISKRDAVIKVMREALEFYGSPESWIIRDKHAWRKSSPKSHGDDEIILNYKHPNRDWVGTVTVGGKKARSALASIQAEGSGE